MVGINYDKESKKHECIIRKYNKEQNALTNLRSPDGQKKSY